MEHLKFCRDLEELHLNTNPGLTGTGLAHLKDCAKLQILTFMQAGITDEGLASFPPLPALVHLRLDGTKVTGTGLIHLKNCPKLGTLDLGSAPITDEGLASLKELPSLTRLDVTGTKITDAGLEHLANVRTLQTVWLHDLKPPLTEAALKKLSLALPNCTLVLDMGKQWKAGQLQAGK